MSTLDMTDTISSDEPNITTTFEEVDDEPVEDEPEPVEDAPEPVEDEPEPEPVEDEPEPESVQEPEPESKKELNTDERVDKLLELLVSIYKKDEINNDIKWNVDLLKIREELNNL